MSDAMLEVARDNVRRFLGAEPHLDATAEELLDGNGYAIANGVMIPFTTVRRLGVERFQ